MTIQRLPALIALLLPIIVAAQTSPRFDDTLTAPPDLLGEHSDNPTANPGANPETTAATASVNEVTVQLSASRPPRVQVKIDGALPDTCTELSDTVHRREGDTWYLTLTAVRPAATVCAPEWRVFQESVTLDTNGVPEGRYRVIVNGVAAGFRLP